MLKVKTEKVISVDDWDKLVSDTYGKPYSFQQQDGCKDRGYYPLVVPSENDEEEADMADAIPEVINGEERIGVKFSTWLARDPKAPLNPTPEELTTNNYYFGKTKGDEQSYKTSPSHIELFWERSFYPNLQTVANDLHEKGLLPEGDYLIDVDW